MNFFEVRSQKQNPHGGASSLKPLNMGFPSLALAHGLTFFDGYRTGQLPANFIQAQRDFFGAHTYERVDQPRGKFFHTDWTGSGGKVTSGSYNV